MLNPAEAPKFWTVEGPDYRSRPFVEAERARLEPLARSMVNLTGRAHVVRAHGFDADGSSSVVQVFNPSPGCEPVATPHRAKPANGRWG